MKTTIYNYRIGHSIANYDLADGCAYASSWGLTSLYDECEKNLRFLLDQRADFRASWDSKKSLQSVTIMRIDDVLHVDVCAWMDDLWESEDLIYDAYYDVTEKEEEIPDEVIDYIRDIANEVGCDDHASASWKGTCPDYDKIMKKIDTLAEEAECQLVRWYEELKHIVEDAIKVSSYIK